MRVFVLCTGRSGSTTFARACAHIKNYTSGHETRSAQYRNRIEYPDCHIEVDNRLAWMLGLLDARYGDDALYVHLRRSREAVARSYRGRASNARGIVRAFSHGIIQADRCDGYTEPVNLMLDTMTANIEAFLKDKTRVINVDIESPHSGFNEMWDRAGAIGDRTAALAEFDQRYNATPHRFKDPLPHRF